MDAIIPVLFVIVAIVSTMTKAKKVSENRPVRKPNLPQTAAPERMSHAQSKKAQPKPEKDAPKLQTMEKREAKAAASAARVAPEKSMETHETQPALSIRKSSASALKRAIVLNEVLSKPVSLRNDRF